MFPLYLFFLVWFQRVICKKKQSNNRTHWTSRPIVVHGWNGSLLLCHTWMCMVSFAFKIGRALWALISSKGLNIWVPIRLGKFQLGLGQTQKKQKLQQLQPYSIQLFINSSSPHVHKGGLAKHQKWQTVTNKTQKMHKQTKQQNPTFKSTLNNERIFCQSVFNAPHLVESPGVFFFLCVFSGSNSCLFTVIADDLHVFSLFRVWV